jgi:hypothetical protein
MNTAQAGSPLVNDPKQALLPKISPQVAVRGLNYIISIHADPTLNTTNNIKKATSIPTRLPGWRHRGGQSSAGETESISMKTSIISYYI